MAGRQKRLRTSSGILGVFLAFVGGTEIHAQEAAAPEEIVVTARRRAERIQDVPMAITAASGETLKQLSIDRPDELSRLAPGFVANTGVYGSGNLTPTIRSQRQALSNSTYDSSVGVYFAEVPQARTQGLNAALFDLESIQVLKGPQGTLFGRNTTGGALLITPAAPTKEFEGYLEGSVGNYSHVGVEGALNLPVSDKFQLRLSGKMTRHDGYIHSITSNTDMNDENSRTWRASARFEPSDRIVNTLVLSGYHEDSGGTTSKLKDVNPTAATASNYGWFAEWQALQSHDFYTTTSIPDGTFNKIDTFSLSNITTIEIGSGTLKNIFGYRHLDGTVSWQLNGDAHDAYHVTAIDKGDQFSNELNYSNKAFDDSLTYIVGLFWFKEDGSSGQISDNAWGRTPAQLEALGGARFILGQPNGREYSVTTAEPLRGTSYSAYAQATYKLPFLPDLSLTGGIRYTRDERSVEWVADFLYRPVPPYGQECRLTDSANVPLNPCFRSGEASWSRPTWTLSADYKVTDDVLLYVAHRRGYRAGGFTLTAYTADSAAPYAPETVDDYEVGAKTTWHPSADTRLTFNVAAYYQDYKDIQRVITVNPSTPGGAISVFMKNAAQATIKGVEVETMLDLGPNLELGGSFAYSDAAYSNFKTDFGDFTGAPFSGAPKYTATWLARYRLLNSEEHGDVFVQVNGYYQSETFSTEGALNQANRTVNVNGTLVNVPKGALYPWDILEPRTIVNAGLEWKRIMGSGLDMRLWAKNVLAEEYYEYISGGTQMVFPGAAAGVPGTPRTYGLTLRYTF